MTPDVVSIPGPPELLGPGPVLFLASNAQVRVLERLRSEGAVVVEVACDRIVSPSDLVENLQASLPSPLWCGPSLDAMEDAFPELVESLPFPVVVALDAFDVLAARDLPLAGQLMFFLTTFGEEFAKVEKQFMAFFCADR